MKNYGPCAFLAIVACAAWLPSATAADQGAPTVADKKPSGQRDGASRREKPSSLDSELPEDLGADALENEETLKPKDARSSGLVPEGEWGSKPKSKADRRDPTSTAGGSDSLDQELLKGLGEDDDAGPSDETNPLTRLSRDMREVESLVAQQRTDDQIRRRQEQIVRDIEDLIRQAKKQGQQGNSSSGSSGSNGQQTASRRNVNQPGKQSAQGPSASTAGRDSTAATRQERARKPDMADMREILKGVWGQLPDRQREQMLQSYEEQFLPKYEQMIADYFRSLAEEQTGKK